MTNILLPIAGLFLATFLIIIFFSKKNCNNKETKIYSRMLIVNEIYAFLGVVGYLYAKIVGGILILSIIQKLYMISMLFLIVYIIVYDIFLINMKKEIQKKFIISLWISLFIISILTLITPINVINYGDVLDGNGLSYNIVYSAAIIYLFLIVLFFLYIFIKSKGDFSKNIPFIILIILYILGLFVRHFMPSIMFENFFFSFMLLIMYHTIENPDIKMLNELSLAKLELEKANKVKSEFASSMSHEIRTPLNAIVGFNELSKKAETLEEAKENSQDVINATNDLLNMIDKIFEVFLIESQDSEVKNEKYNPMEILMNIFSLYEYKIKDKGIKFTKNIKNDIPNLYGDPDILKKIITNILDNAYKFTNVGEIVFTSEYKSGNLIMVIEDTGIGIKEEELDNIFVPFSKSTDTKNTSFSGMGLGLSITKNLLDKIGGKIEIQSIYQKGTKVTLNIKQKRK